MTIFIDENIPLLYECLKNEFKVNQFSGRKLTNYDLKSYGAEILITRSTTHVNELLLKETNIKLVCTATAGTDHFDQNYLEINGIQYYSAPGANANSVAEYVVYSILKWGFENNVELDGKVIGIIGYGNIGKTVAEYAIGLGLEVLINDPPLDDMGFKFPNKFKYCDIDYIFKNSDIITNHVPLNKTGKYNTVDLINDSRIKMIKPGSLFIHSSRGSVVNENSLLKRLKRNELVAAIDVWNDEPDFNTDLAPNSMLCSPHVAGYSRNGKLNGTLMMLDAVEAFTGKNTDRSLIHDELNNKDRKKISEFENHLEIQNTLKKNREFEIDSEQFLELIKLNNDKRKEGFDKLRKNFPVRYESLII